MANENIEVLYFIVDEDSTSIDSSCLTKIEAQLKNISGERIFLVIHTGGGDPFSAVRIMRVIQEKYSKISTIVPSHAMSAGTLMALGSDEIYMQQKSMLGPLDLPMEHPSDGSRISALDINNTIPTIAGLSDSIADERYDFLRKKAHLGKNVAARLAMETANEFVKPIMEKIDPYHLQKSSRELNIGWWYAYDLLLSRMMKDKPAQAWDTARTLVRSFPAHEYGIFSNDARGMLKLNVFDLGKLDEWCLMESKYNSYIALKRDVIIKEDIERPSKKTEQKENAKK